MKTTLILSAACILFASCNKDDNDTPSHNYRCSVGVTSMLYKRIYPNYTADSARVYKLGSDSAIRIFTIYHVDTFTNKDTAFIQNIIKEKTVSYKLQYPYNIYSYSEDTIAKNAGSYECGRIN